MAKRRSLDEITTTVFRITADRLGVAIEKVSRESRLENDFGADSLDTVELAMELEEEFDVNIPDDAVEKFGCLGDWIDHINEAAPVVRAAAK